jgi:hypothetical protein
MQQLEYNNGNGVFLHDACQDVISKGQSQLLVDFCTGGCEERTLACEVEDSPLLRSVVRKWLVKTKQAGKGLVSAVVICEMWRLAVAL